MRSRRVAVSTMLSLLRSKYKFSVCVPVWVCVLADTRTLANVIWVVTADRENYKLLFPYTWEHDVISCTCILVPESVLFKQLRMKLSKNLESLSHKFLFRSVFVVNVHEHCGHLRCIFKSSGSSSAASLDMEKHIVAIHRKKDSELISLNSLLPCLHISWGLGFDLAFKASQNSAQDSLCVCMSTYIYCICVYLCVQFHTDFDGTKHPNWHLLWQ